MSTQTTRTRAKPKLAFTSAESERAFDTWRANCGPHALAAAVNLSLGEVKKALIESFSGSMSPTQMSNALTHFGIEFTVEKNLRTHELRNGIGYIQWDGKWVRSTFRQERYKHTHWIASRNGWVFDLNSHKLGWDTERAWRDEIGEFAGRKYDGWFFWQWYEF